MEFSLEVFFNDLAHIIAKKQDPAETVKELSDELEWSINYAIECGALDAEYRKRARQ